MKAVHTPFSIVKENSYVPGCTVSQQLLMGPSAAFLAFCLAPQTDISPETYAYPKLLTVLDGAMMVQAGGAAFPFPKGKASLFLMVLLLASAQKTVRFILNYPQRRISS